MVGNRLAYRLEAQARNGDEYFRPGIAALSFGTMVGGVGSGIRIAAVRVGITTQRARRNAGHGDRLVPERHDILHARLGRCDAVELAGPLCDGSRRRRGLWISSDRDRISACDLSVLLAS